MTFEIDDNQASNRWVALIESYFLLIQQTTIYYRKSSAEQKQRWYVVQNNRSDFPSLLRED
jgi:hypothetical protein